MKHFFIVLAFLGMTTLCFADTTIIQKVASGPVMGQSGTNAIQTMKIKGTKARIDHDNVKQYQILDLAAKKVYTIDNEKKQAMVMSLDMMNAAGAMFKQMNKDAKLNIQNTGNTRTVNGFKCTDYVISMTGGMGLTSKQCLTKDIDSSDFEAFRPYAEGMVKMFLGDNAAQLPEGMAVVTETQMTMLGQKVDSKTELQSVKKEEIPGSVFEIPAGYAVTEMPGMPKQ
ncbi:DUF4412 domain-containing protein [bacterium]|nr:DUF4412 domain-containing protein [bacterium]